MIIAEFDLHKPFALKNAGVTYKRLINEMFADLLMGKMEAYIDDLLVKS